MKDLTSTQRTILDYIHAYAEAVGRAPTVAEIQAAFDYTSRSTVYAHLHRLERKGYLENDTSEHLSRYAINLTNRAKRLFDRTLLAEHHLQYRYIGDIVTVPDKPQLLKEFFPDAKSGDFLYRIWTNRYLHDGILPGATAIMRPNSIPLQQGYGLITIEDVVRFRHFTIEGTVIRVEREESSSSRIEFSVEHSPIIAVMIATIDINFWT